jgi:hypothetical protein
MRRVSTILLCAAAFALFQIATAPNALADPILGSNLSTFAVLGGSTVTNTGPTTLTGSLGVSPGSAITGFYGTVENDGPGTINSGTGVVHEGDPFANLAHTQLITAITALEGMASSATDIPGGILGGKTLGPGVYTTLPSDTLTMGLTGTLTLDGGGNANALWVFLVHSALTTASSSVVSVIDTGAGAGVYWVMETESATLGSSSTFEGNILAYASITAGTSATDPCGRLLAQTGAVSLGANTIGIGCSDTLAGSNGLSGGGTLSYPNGPTGTPVITPLPYDRIPEPGTFMLLGAGIACLVARRRRFGARAQRDLASKA